MPEVNNRPTPDMREFRRLLRELPETLAPVEGHLTPREWEFLALLAACPTTSGEVLEIGSFKGKSTITLAKAAALSGSGRIVAVDPLTSPSVTDPDLRGAPSSLEDLQANLRRAGADRDVEFHQMYSADLAETWNASRRIRLLWIDGDHTYPGAKADFDMFAPFLSDGAIVAFHDVLNEFDGPIRVMIEDVLSSDYFGASGVCGSIGWSQYREDPSACRSHEHAKARLRGRMADFLPYAALGGNTRGLQGLMRKTLRARVPHSAVDPEKWMEEVAFVGEAAGH